jgi:hypothetical protein
LERTYTVEDELGTKVTSDNLTIRGVNVNMNVSKALEVLKKDESHIESDPISNEYSLSPEPGFSIDIKKDIETIKSIHIYKRFKGLKGKTSLFFKLQTKEAVQEFLIKHLGKPKEIINISLKGLCTGFKFVYPGGITYSFMKNDNEIFSDNYIVIQPFSTVSAK